MYKMIMVLLLISSLIYPKLPEYAINMAKGFRIPLWLARNWSYKESSHNKNTISHKKAYGRYQIRYVWFVDYMRYQNRNPKNVKDYKKFLLNDYNNIYITYWSYAFWRRLGFDARNIMQVWLNGLEGVFRDDKWCYYYQYKIFGDRKEKKLNWKAYNYLIRHKRINGK